MESSIYILRKKSGSNELGGKERSMSDIVLKEVDKKIKDNWVLKDINLTFHAGKIYGLSGCNGSGKTMLLRMIAGLIRPSKGEVMFGDQVLHKDIEFPESIGVLIEQPAFWNNYTGFEALKTLANIRKRISDADIKETMRSVNLDPEEKKTIRKYSLGMRQKLGIAQAIMENPDVILLDEPTNALDKNTIKKVREMLLEEAKKDKIIVIASHNVMDLEICDEVIELEEGSVIYE